MEQSKAQSPMKTSPAPSSPQYRSFYMKIVSASDTEIKGTWYNDETYPGEWLDYTYTKIPDTKDDLWNGQFTIVSSESMEMAISKVVCPDAPERAEVGRSMDVSSPVMFYEYNVKILVTRSKSGKITGLKGSGTNRYGSFILEAKTTTVAVVGKVVDDPKKPTVIREVFQGNTTHLHVNKTYTSIHRFTLKRQKPGLDSAVFTMERRKRHLANAIRSSLKDRRYDLEQKVLSGEMNYPEVVAVLDEPSRKLLQRKVNLLVWTARHRALKAFMSRHMERDRIKEQIRSMHEQIDKVRKIDSIK